jgi:hypothetical protein
MSMPIANVNPSSDTWSVLFDRINQVATYFTNYAVTAFPNTSGGYTSGNAYVQGIFCADTLSAGINLTGGSVTTPNTLIITSNVTSNGQLALFNSNVSIVAQNTSISSNVTSVIGNTFNVTSNTTFSNTTWFTAPATFDANVFANGALFQSTANVDIAAANVTISGGYANVLSTAQFQAEVDVLGPTLKVLANTNLDAANVTIQGGTLTVLSEVAVGLFPTGNAIPLGNTTARFSLWGLTADIASTLNVSGNTTLVGNSTVISSANTTLSGTNTSVIGTNLVVGANTTLNGTSVTFNGNTTVNGTTFTINANTIHGGTTYAVNANTTFAGNTTTLAANVTTVAGNTFTITTPNTTFSGNTVTFTSNTVTTGGSNILGANVVTIAGNTLNVTSNATFSGPANFTNTLTANTLNVADINANVVTVNGLVDFVSLLTANVGSNVTTPQTILTVPLASYNSGRLNVQLKTGAPVNGSTYGYQFCETLFVHDGQNVSTTTFGLLYSNTELGTISASINGANVNINVTQLSPNLEARVVAQLTRL